MYTQEIKELLKIKNYILDSKEFIDIIDNSPQIDHIIYQNEQFEIYSNDGLNEKIKVYVKEK